MDAFITTGDLLRDEYIDIHADFRASASSLVRSGLADLITAVGFTPPSKYLAAYSLIAISLPSDCFATAKIPLPTMSPGIVKFLIWNISDLS